MRFLCLHGAGTNSHVLEIQTGSQKHFFSQSMPAGSSHLTQQSGPIREVLGTDATFEFYDGFLEVSPTEEIKDIFAGPLYTWYSPGLDGHTLVEAKAELLDLIATEGPFDACLGFSQGAALLAAFIMDHQALHPYGSNLFNLAVFICGGSPLLVTKSLEQREACYLPRIEGMAPLTEPWPGPYVPEYEPHADEQWNVFRAQKMKGAGLTIRIPTAHIYGSKDHTVKGSLNLRDMCDPRTRVEFDHGGRHEVPRKARIVQQMATTVKRAIDKVMTSQ